MAGGVRGGRGGKGVEGDQRCIAASSVLRRYFER